MIRSPSATMNSARDRAENIIDELQAFLNTQQSQDDSLASPDLDLDLSQSFMSGQTEVNASLINGHVSAPTDRQLDSFHLPESLSGSGAQTVDLPEDSSHPSQLAGTSEVLLMSERAVSQSFTFSSSLSVTQRDDIEVNSASVLSDVTWRDGIEGNSASVQRDVTLVNGGSVNGVSGELETLHAHDDSGRGGTSFTALSSSLSAQQPSDGEKGDKISPDSHTVRDDTQTSSAVVTSSFTRTAMSVHQTNGAVTEHSDESTTDFIIDSTAAETGEVETRKTKPSGDDSTQSANTAPQTEDLNTKTSLTRKSTPLGDSVQSVPTTPETESPLTNTPLTNTPLTNTPLTNTPLPGYDWLETLSPPPPPGPVKEYSTLPFPMIFRRSKKDPGSHQYRQLVRELEEVLDKRSQVRRTSSLRDLRVQGVGEGRGTLRGTKTLSSSTEHLSVFSNKALLSHLENHLQKRNQPAQDRTILGAGGDPGKGEGGLGKGDGGLGKGEGGGVIWPQVQTSSSSSLSPSSPAQPTSRTVVNGHVQVTGASGQSVESDPSPGVLKGHVNVTASSGQSVESTASPGVMKGHVKVSSSSGQSIESALSPGQVKGNVQVSSHRASAGATDSAVSIIQVGSDPRPAASGRPPTSTPTTNRVHVSSPLPSPPDPDSFSQVMSFGSEEDFPSAHRASTLPAHGAHYKKHMVHAHPSRVHPSPSIPSRVHPSPSRVHPSPSNPNVLYKTQSLDRNFQHITRIAVSRSEESLPACFRSPPPVTEQNSDSSAFPWRVERQNSSPMKTIVEHFTDTEPEEVSAWNAAIRNSKKHKDKGLYRSISQRMVQKIYRFVRPKSTGNVLPSSSSSSSSAVSRSKSFSTPALQDAHTIPRLASKAGASESHALSPVKQEDVLVTLPNHHKLHVVRSEPPGGAVSDISLQSRKTDQTRYRDPQGYPQAETGHGVNGFVTVQLPHSANGSVQLPHSANGSVSPRPGRSARSSGGEDSAPAPHSPPRHMTTIQATEPRPLFQRNQGQSSFGQWSPSGQAAQDSQLVVDLPNHHTATITPTGIGSVAMVTQGSSALSVPMETRSMKVTRSSSYRQTYRSSDSGGSPFTQEISEGVLPPAYGDGLHRGEEDKAATFFIDARGMAGEPFVQVDGPNSIAKCSLECQPDGQYLVTYIPVEVGMFDVLVRWNGKELPGSPFHPKVVCARKVLVVGGWQHYMDNRERVHLVVNEEKTIPFDVADAGPGKMTAEVKGPSGLIPVTVDDSTVGRSTVIFTPRDEGIHSIYLYWSDTPLVNSPFQGYATGGVLDPSKVILTGRGLKEAIVQEEAEFIIDASQAGTGDPEVQLTGVRAEVSVFVTPLGGGKFRCTYIPVVPGAYLLHISWNGRQLRGSPYKVNIMGAFYPNKVVVSGEGLKGGLLGRDFDIRIDTRKAGPGELTAYCVGPSKVAHCELEDHHDGTFRLIVQPQEAGRHVLQVKYGGEHVLGSPFDFKVSAQPDASKVRVSGPGVEHGILATFQSRFVVETRGAGAGQLTVRIRGPKGAFQVEMYRDSQKDRTILCRYDPVETGLYIISIRWSGGDVPGSPFHVHILDTQAELEQVLADQSFHNQSFHNQSFHSSRTNNSGYGQWREEF